MAKGEEEGQIDGCVHSRGWRKGVRMECLVAKVARPRPPHLLRSRRKRTSWTKDFMLIPAGR